MKSGLRIGAVSFLNTVPLVWGLVRGPWKGKFKVSFVLPSECADQLAAGELDVGLVPSAELARLPVKVIPGLGIACAGTIRSILLASKLPLPEIRTLACDAASRSSTMLARMILRERYGVEPRVVVQPADLQAMLQAADAALIIGDPALRLDPPRLPYLIKDLGEEWYELTGKPMVFAVWAARRELEPVVEELAAILRASYQFGREHLEQIIAQESARRGIPKPLARAYLTRYVIHELGREEYAGLEQFLERVRQMEPVIALGSHAT